MAGTINSLGIGSGVLTADLIDKLRNNERSAIINPIEAKITLAGQKQEAMDLLSSLTTTFKSSVSSLGQDTLYQERTINGNNDDVTVTAVTGTALQSFAISDISLATTNVQQSGSFANKTDKIATAPGVMNISVNGQNFSIDYDENTSLEELKDKITNSGANDKLTASILQIGENDYTFLLTSKETGRDQTITVTDDTGNLNSTLLSTVHKSGTFVGADSTIAGLTTSGTLTVDINGIAKDLIYDDTTTLEQLKDMINADDTLKGIVSANIVKEGDFDFKLVLTPIGAQAGQAVNITDSVGGGLDANILTTGSTTVAGSLNEVQSASDSSFKYNGISISRSSNTIDDVLSGVSISLHKNGGNANISIGQDRQPIITELTGFVASYNALQSQLTNMTKADLANGKVGIFNGDSSIRNIGREITKIITSFDLNGNSLAQFGIGLNEDGSMSFNQTDFNTKMDEDPENVSVFFSGKTTVDAFDVATHADGIFETLNNQLLSYTKSDGLLSLMNDGLETQFKSLQTQHEKSLALLNARYETMTQRFIAFDTIINRLNSQGSNLSQQIDMAIAAAKG